MKKLQSYKFTQHGIETLDKMSKELGLSKSTTLELAIYIANDKRKEDGVIEKSLKEYANFFNFTESISRLYEEFE